MPYILPQDVVSPKAHWKLIRVLLDRGAGGCAYALGEWDGVKRIGFRWNGYDEGPIGNPQSRGLPTWTMLDEEAHEGLLSLLPKEEKLIARQWLGLGLIFEAVSLVRASSAIALWDLGQNPPVVAKIECQAIKDLIGKSTISDEDCRLLAETNKDLVTRIAEELFKAKRFRLNDNQCRIIDITLEDLKAIEKEFSSTVLQIKMQWLQL